MKKNGFITSALLYGILSLFLILILGTVSILANRKLANDKIKESVLNDVQKIETSPRCFQTDISEYAEREREVLAAHKSQTERLLIELCKDTQFSKEARERWFEKENFYYYDINDWISKEKE